MIKCPNCKYKKGYDVKHGWINENDYDFYRSNNPIKFNTDFYDEKCFTLLVCPKCNIVFVNTTSL